MRGKRVEPLEIENAEKVQFLVFHLHFLMICINLLLFLLPQSILFGFVIGYYVGEEMQCFG